MARKSGLLRVRVGSQGLFVITTILTVLALTSEALAARGGTCAAAFTGSATAAKKSRSKSAPMSDPSTVKKEIKALIDLSHLTTPDSRSVVLQQTATLQDFLYASDDDNLAVRSPFNVMNAAQRMLALIYSQGVKKVRLPLTNEEVEVFSFFSGGLPITKNGRIVGNEKVIAEFVANLKAQASGDRSGSSLILLVGSHGTGKSETLKLLGKGAETLTSKVDLDFAAHTFIWKNLGAIPGLHKYIPTVEQGGKKTYADVPAPLGDSPFVLLPEEVQDILVDKARTRVEKLLNGMEPSPWRTPDPISNFIRNAIIQHYSEERGHTLNPAEIVEVLSKHVVVKRQILGQTFGKMPIIDVQGNDIDVQGLFMTPNPAIRYASGEGPTHPMAWYLNGKVATGHGNAVLFDEFFRNPEELRNMLLSAFESRELSIAGAPQVPFDAVMIAATNTANLEQVQSEATGEAAADRFDPQAMRWSLFPNEIGQILLSGKVTQLYQQSLAADDAPITPAKIDELLPRAQGLERVRTPDYRYRMFIGKGPNKVMIAPHALILMSEIIAASRMQLDPAKASKVYSGKILGSNLLRNPIDRLRLYEGLKPDVPADELKELIEVGQRLKEGETGISARDAGRWLSAAINEARTERAGFTLTPGVLLKVFRTRMNEKKIKVPSNKEMLRWLELAEEVTFEMLIPRLQADISKALANGDRVVQDTYWDILEEMWAEHDSDGTAKTYRGRGGQEMSIDYERLKKIKEIYAKKNGRALSISQVSLFHARQNEVGGAGRVPDEALLDAIATYYASLNEKVAGFSRIVEFEQTGQGSDEVRAAHASLVGAMKSMGYNDVAIRDALMLVRDFRSRSESE